MTAAQAVRPRRNRSTQRAKLNPDNARRYTDGPNGPDDPLLNISAVCEEFNVKRSTFKKRQQRGWVSLSGRRLSPHRRLFRLPGANLQAPENTYLRSDVVTAMQEPPGSIRRLKACVLEARRFTPLDDGIRIGDARSTYQHALKTLYEWCLEEMPLLGRRLNHDCCDGPRGHRTVYISREDLETINGIQAKPYNRRILGNEGVWLAEGIFQRDDKTLALTVEYITDRLLENEPSEIASDATWVKWTRFPCPDLPSDDNERKIPAWPAIWPAKPRQPFLVLDQTRVLQIIERRRHLKNSDPAGASGRWLTDEIFQDANMRLWFRILYMKREYRVTQSTLDYWERTEHPNLDPPINDGKLRSLTLTKLIRTARGKPYVKVYSQDDWEKIAAHRHDQKHRACDSKATKGYLQLPDLLIVLGLTTHAQQRSLPLLLPTFRAENPNAAELVDLWDEKRNRATPTWHYEPSCLTAWINGRDVVELANKQRRNRPRRNPQRFAKRVAKAEKFLRGALAQGPVLRREIKQAARNASIAEDALWEAKKRLQVKSFHKGFQRPSYWHLPEEVASDHGKEVAISEAIEPQDTPPAGAGTLPIDQPREVEVPQADSDQNGSDSRGRRPVSKQTQNVKAMSPLDTVHTLADDLVRNVRYSLLVMQEDEKSGREEPGALRPEIDVPGQRELLAEYLQRLAPLRDSLHAASPVTAWGRSAASAYELVEAVVEDFYLFVEHWRQFWHELADRLTVAQLATNRRESHQEFFDAHTTDDLATLSQALEIERRSAKSGDEATQIDDNRSGTAKHSPDFRSVLWFGKEFAFTSKQAECVRILWEAWENGTPIVGQAHLLAEAESDAERLSLLFRGHTCWNSMIVQAQRGAYRLNSPA